MPDITTVWSLTAGGGDWVMTPVGLASGDDLQTALLISYFSDQTASPDDVIPDTSGDPRGWWGDLGEDYPIGSKLWLLARAKQTPGVLAKAQLYARSATEWMISDGVVASVNVVASYPRKAMLGLQTGLIMPDKTARNFNFAWAWQELQ